MEGVVDPIMRDLLTRIGGIDRCVTEFVRVSERVLPTRVFHRLSPELRQGGRTASGVPVYVQLLGSEPEVLAGNAVRAAALGAPGIDLNFGCPAKTVNRNRGGAVLLQEPELVHRIVAAVRAAVPGKIPVTAKMRLGVDDKSRALENAVAIAEAGADELCVHARTKAEGYRPPAHWQWIEQIRGAVDIPVIANGDVFSPDDYRRCRRVSGCEDVMIGRGLLQRPDLARGILSIRETGGDNPMGWRQVLLLLTHFCRDVNEQVAAKHAPGRLKQWLAFLSKHYPQASALFATLKKESCPQQISRLLAEQLDAPESQGQAGGRPEECFVETSTGLSLSA